MNKKDFNKKDFDVKLPKSLEKDEIMKKIDEIEATNEAASVAPKLEHKRFNRIYFPIAAALILVLAILPFLVNSKINKANTVKEPESAESYNKVFEYIKNIKVEDSIELYGEAGVDQLKDEESIGMGSSNNTNDTNSSADRDFGTTARILFTIEIISFIYNMEVSWRSS